MRRRSCGRLGDGFEQSAGVALVGHGSRLSARLEQVALAVFESRSQEEASVRCGVSKRSIGRWHQREDFKRVYRQLGRNAFERAASRLRQLSVQAANCLGDGLEDHVSPNQLRAAQLILEHALKAGELADIAERLEILEEKAR